MNLSFSMPSKSLVRIEPLFLCRRSVYGGCEMGIDSKLIYQNSIDGSQLNRFVTVCPILFEVSEVVANLGSLKFFVSTVQKRDRIQRRSGRFRFITFGNGRFGSFSWKRHQRTELPQKCSLLRVK